MLAERVMEWTEEWKRQGHKEGDKEGEAAVLPRQAERKYRALSAAHREKIAEAHSDTLLR